MNELIFTNKDRRFGFRIENEHVGAISKICRECNGDETGGILIGYYTTKHDSAIVTSLVGKPPDSRSGHNWFIRGTRGLQKLLNLFWHKHRLFYLGEWHFHPNSDPDPSPQDMDQMRSISQSNEYNCPEPVLFIVGGNPLIEWVSKAFVFPRDEEHMELLPDNHQTK